MMQNNASANTLTRDVFKLFSMWKIEQKEQINLLGLPSHIKPRALNKYQTETLPEDDETQERLNAFLEMHEALLHAFPHNESLANYWVTTESDLFYGKRPLDVMLNSGLEGIHYVLNHLKQSEQW
jgi:hypothetical protein